MKKKWLKRPLIVGLKYSPNASIKVREDPHPNTSCVSELLPEDFAIQPLKAMVRDHRIPLDRVDVVYLASAISVNVEPTLFQAPAKYILLKLARELGVPIHAVGRVVERACASSLTGAWSGARKVMLGKADLVIVIGLDMMCRSPNSVILRGLTNPVDPGTGELMAVLADRKARELWPQLTIEELRTKHNKYAYESYCRAWQHKNEPDPLLVPICLREGEAPVITYDEEMDRYKRKFDRFGEDKDAIFRWMNDLKPYPGCEVMTILNSSKYATATDCLAIASPEIAGELGLTPLAEIVSSASTSGRNDHPEDFITQVEDSIILARGRARECTEFPGDWNDVVVINNEAFATGCLKLMEPPLNIPWKNLNLSGSAIAKGHPIGATGIRRIGDAIRDMERLDKNWAMIAVCAAIGEGPSMAIRRIP